MTILFYITSSILVLILFAGFYGQQEILLFCQKKGYDVAGDIVDLWQNKISCKNEIYVTKYGETQRTGYTDKEYLDINEFNWWKNAIPSYGH